MTTTSSTSDVPDTGSAARAFKPGPGFYILIGLIVLTGVVARGRPPPPPPPAGGGPGHPVSWAASPSSSWGWACSPP